MKSKSKFLTILIFIFSVNQSIGQINLSEEYIDSIQRYNYELGNELRTISFYNKIINSENLIDTIIPVIVDGKIVYNYKNKVIRELKMNINNDSPIQMEYSRSSHLRYIYAIVNKNDIEQFRLLVTNSESCDTKIRIENYKDEVLCGNYIEKCSTGEIYEMGYYHQIDSIYLDTITYFDPETYVEIVKIEARKKFPIKCGKWQIKTEKGILTKEFDPCK